MKKVAILSFFLFFLISCSTRTTVILLPDEDGSAGSVIVNAEDSDIELETAYTAATIGPTAPGSARQLTADQVQKSFSEVLQATPAKPEKFFLYFTFNETQLTTASKRLIPQILAVVEKRRPATISIIGHTDRAGREAFNARLSLQRATSVKNILLDAGIDSGTIFVAYHGEYNLPVPTSDGVRDPRNRCVEIMVR